MERKRKAVDKGKSKSELASPGNIQSRVTTTSMKKHKDGSSLSIKTGAASPYHFSKFIGNPKQAGSSGSNGMISCFARREFPNGFQDSHITVEESRGATELLPQSVRGPLVWTFCEICCERKEIFRNEACRHRICANCISMHIQARVSSNSGEILCPGLDCKVALTLDRCKDLLPENVAERWEKMMIEMMIPESEKFYCPFKDCSGTLQNDNAEEMRKMKEAECPHCRRLFCVQCLVPWHSGMKCREFQRLNSHKRGLREDIQMKNLAEEKKWMRCPQCKFYVEKTAGCVFMKCRCKCAFCYRCGQKWSTNHGTCYRP